MSANTLAPKGKSFSIQLVRVAACLMVFAVHFGQRMGFTGVLGELTYFGKYGVELFFLISGYLCALSMAGHREFDVKRYYAKRIAAILPLYYLVILYYFFTENLLVRFGAQIPSDEQGLGWLRYLFLLNGFVNSDTYFWSNLGITWTIPIFAFFYLIAPWTVRWLSGVRAALLAWLFTFCLTGALSLVYPCTIFANLHYFFLGVLLLACVRADLYDPAIFLSLLASLPFIILNSRDYAYVCLFFAILLVLLRSAQHIVLPSALSTLVDVLDKYSYTIYLVHGIIFCSILDRLIPLGVPRRYLALIAIAGTTVLTFLVGRFLEKPLQAFLRRLLKL